MKISLIKVFIDIYSPPQWESRYYEYNEKFRFYLRGNFSYDSVNKRERIIDEVMLGFDKEYYDVIYLHQEQKQYSFNLKTKKCRVEPLTRPWRDIGIPKDATFYRESYVGSSQVPNAGLLTTVWGGEIEGCRTKYLLQFTETACIPVAATYFSIKSGTTALHFTDVVPGIADANVFTPRKECLEAEKESSSEENIITEI